MEGKGPLVRIELEPGRWVTMYRADAYELGYLKPEPVRKRRRPAGDKMLRPEGDKDQGHEGQDGHELHELDEGEEGDDLTEIPGVGPATAAVLRARGIETCSQLRTADLTGLHHLTRKAIERWREETEVEEMGDG